MTVGDVKFGFQSADHNGWILLDGRSLSTLTTTQMARASALSIGANLPDATNAVLIQNNDPVGVISGSNERTLVRSDLPDVSLGCTTSLEGDHDHILARSTVVNTGLSAARPILATQNNHTFDNYAAIPGGTTGTPNVGLTGISGGHNHTVTTESLNGGVVQTSINVTPRSLSLNAFLYLGS